MPNPTASIKLSPQNAHRFELLRDKLFMTNSQLASYAIEQYLESLNWSQVIEKVIK